MERHAYTLHTALSRRGHQVHVFTSPPDGGDNSKTPTSSPFIHCHEGEPGRWRYNKAWEQFLEENKLKPFDVVHSESVALPHWLARNLDNLVVSWHGIALESLQSNIVQDLTRHPNEPMSPAFNRSVQGVIPKVLNEIRFFKSYAHHVAISDSCGEMLRDMYQIPTKRVHVILNGVDEDDFVVDSKSGQELRSKIGIPNNASIVFGIAGRLVKDKGHPLLYEAFSSLITKHPNVYLIVAGSGPWQSRYKDIGSNVIVLGSMSPSELGAFYNAIDIFVNPTLRPQGLDLTLMEAMMSGKAVMASRFPSIKGSIVVDDEFGYMFAPNVESLLEAMEMVVEEGSMRLAQRGKACREYAASMFTATKMALAYERQTRMEVNATATLISNFRIYKAKYYPDGFFLSAEMGGSPSFAWRSIMKAQSLLKKGGAIRVGSGANVSILNDPWLSDGSDPYVHTVSVSLVDKKVSQLMSMEHDQWDMDILYDIFEERDINLIVSIPIQVAEADTWWSGMSRQLVVMLCWALWKSRNDPVWNQKHVEVTDVVVLALRVLNQWLYAQDKTFDPSLGLLFPEDGNEHWTSPNIDTIKINTDATIFSLTNYYSYSCVARTHASTLLEAKAKCVRGVVSPRWLNPLAYMKN
uniref:Glycosyltransferase n=1 Tax=Cannabis sativa TaxID=3483 RepID=A0A803PQ37_CANSA